MNPLKIPINRLLIMSLTAMPNSELICAWTQSGWERLRDDEETWVESKAHYAPSWLAMPTPAQRANDRIFKLDGPREPVHGKACLTKS